MMTGRRIPGNSFGDDRGAVAVIVALSMTVLLGIAAFVVDLGYLQWQKRHLQNAADAAALAGARELLENEGDVEAIIKQYVSANGLDENTDIDKIDIDNNSERVRVVLKVERDLFFARALGFGSQHVAAKAAAAARPIGKMDNLRPLGILKDNVDGLKNEDLFSLYEKADPDKEEHKDAGNWGTVNFEGSGSPTNDISTWVENGYEGVISIHDDQVHTAPGAGANAYKDLIPLNTEIFVPVVDWLPGEGGGSTQVSIVGFACIEIVGIEGSGANLELTAKYKETIVHQEIDQEAQDFGLRRLTLVE